MYHMITFSSRDRCYRGSNIQHNFILLIGCIDNQTDLLPVTGDILNIFKNKNPQEYIYVSAVSNVDCSGSSDLGIPFEKVQTPLPGLRVKNA